MNHSLLIFPTEHGLCLMEISIGHIRIRTHVQEWTRVHYPMCPVETFTGHKSDHFPTKAPL